MADLASDTSPDRLSVGVAAGALSLAVVLAVAVGAWTWGCDAGLPWTNMCGANTAAVAEPVTPAPVKAAGTAAPAKAPLQLVAATFESLDAAAPANAAKPKSTTTRVVKTIQVRPENAPGTASAAVAGMGQGNAPGSASDAVPLAPTVAMAYMPAVVAAAGGGAAAANADAAVQPLPAKPHEVKPEAAAHGHAQIVGGKGVSVRAAPKSGAKVLFNLAAGKKVTVSGKERGWLHITDPEGRDGWAYSSLFRDAG